MMVNYLKYIAAYVLLAPFSQDGTADGVAPSDPPEYSVNTAGGDIVPLATDGMPQSSTSAAMDAEENSLQENERSNPAASDGTATPSLAPAPLASQPPMVGNRSIADAPTVQDQAAPQQTTQDEFQAKALERAMERQASQIQASQQHAKQQDAQQKAFYENSVRLQPPQHQIGDQGAPLTSHSEQPLVNQEQEIIAGIEAKLVEIQDKVQAIENQKNIEISEIQAKLMETQEKIQAVENQKNNEKQAYSQQENQPLNPSSPDEHGNTVQDESQKPERTLHKAQAQ